MKSKSSDVFHLDLASPTTACGGTQNIGQRHFTSLCNQGICASGYQEFEFTKDILGLPIFPSHSRPLFGKRVASKWPWNAPWNLERDGILVVVMMGMLRPTRMKMRIVYNNQNCRDISWSASISFLENDVLWWAYAFSFPTEGFDSRARRNCRGSSQDFPGPEKGSLCSNWLWVRLLAK